MQWNCLATFNVRCCCCHSWINWLTDWMTEWLPDWLSEWVSDCLTEIGKQLQQHWQLCTLSLSSTHMSFVCVASVVAVGCYCFWRLSFECETKMKTKLDPHCFDRFGRICRLLRLAKCYTRSSMPQIKCDQFGQAAAAVATAMASLGNQIRMQTFVKGQSSQSVNQSICQSVNQSSKQVCNMQAQTRIHSTRLVRPSNN